MTLALDSCLGRDSNLMDFPTRRFVTHTTTHNFNVCIGVFLHDSLQDRLAALLEERRKIIEGVGIVQPKVKTTNAEVSKTVKHHPLAWPGLLLSPRCFTHVPHLFLIFIYLSSPPHLLICPELQQRSLQPKR